MIVRQPGGPQTKLDPNGQYMVEQMYVQYFLPKNKKGKLPLLLWHGGGLTGVTYESTPDGREGWMNFFVRKGWDTYVSDAVERGRSGFAPPDVALLEGERVLDLKGRLSKLAVITGSVVDESGEIVARPTVLLTLACDHRILYGADGARFLGRLRELLERPLALLL